MGLIEEMKEWQTDLEELGKEKGKAEGRLEQAMADMKEAGFATLEEAKAEQEQRVALKAQAEKDAQDLLENFKVKYEGHIE